MNFTKGVNGLKITAVAVSDRGAALAERLREGASAAFVLRRCERAELPQLSPDDLTDGILFLICPVADAVCAVASLYKFDTFPVSIIQIDEFGKYVVPFAPIDSSLSADLAKQAATAIGAIPVLSAPEQLESFAIDKWALAAGLRIANPEAVTSVKEKLLSGEPVCYNSIFPIAGALPPGIHEGCGWEKVDFAVSFLSGFDEKTLLLVPPVLSLGLDGAACSAETLSEEFDAFMSDLGLHPLALGAVCCRTDSPLCDAARALSQARGARFCEIRQAQFAAGGLRFAETRYPYLPENDSEKCAVLGMDGGLLIRRTERGGVGFALAVLEPQD